MALHRTRRCEERRRGAAARLITILPGRWQRPREDPLHASSCVFDWTSAPFCHQKTKQVPRSRMAGSQGKSCYVLDGLRRSNRRCDRPGTTR
ncbi:hypothetical protein ANT2_2789 [plant metagenome]|uniref:Uncharacterized protein n=1 Tax=plant metagenome TaxID=1297885 RepID=A0A484SFA6_9ZZZZ